MGPEGFTLDILGRTMTVTQNKDLVCAITVTPKEGQRLHRVIKTSDRTVIPPYTRTTLAIQHVDIPEGRDFIFEPAFSSHPVSLFTHVIDSSTARIMAENSTDYAVVIPRKSRLGRATEYD